MLLYENLYAALCVFARGYNVGRKEAEDAVQEVFSRLYDERCLLENITSLKSYLYMSVRNCCLNRLRDEKRRKNRESAFIGLVHDERAFFDEMIESEVYRQLHMLLNEFVGGDR